MRQESINTRIESKLGFDRIRNAIAGRCSTEYASERVENETFSSNPREIRKRLQLTDEMRLILMFEDSFPTNGYIDTLPFLRILAKDGSNIDKLNLAKLRTMLETVRRVTNFFQGIKDGVYPGLKRMASPVMFFPEVQRRIDVILDRYGEIKDTASDQLYSIRKSLKEKQNAISKVANAVLKKAQQEGLVDSDMGLSIRDGKYLIPVNSSSKRSIPGYVHDQSASGKTSFVEPAEVVELENDISELFFAESREIARILAEFSDFVRPYVPDLISGAVFLGEMDFIIAKAQTALDMRAGMPVISDDGQMNLRKARHPILEKTLKKEGREMVPLSVSLSPKKHIVLISGPNAGGKSVCLKTVGLLQYMFQCGLLIPTSEASELPVFDRIMLSIGDDQSIDNDLSTYSSFLADMKEVVNAADSKTLVLIDEFGSGTEPAAGGAIAEAILEELDHNGVYGVITTHYTNLKLYASASDTGVLNAAMQFDAKNIAPLFKLETGLPGNSFAFELARKMGLPENIVKSAEEKAGEEFVGIERNLRRIARNRKALDEKLQKIKNTDKVLENITGKYEKELKNIRQQKQEIIDEARKEAEQIVKGANKQVENTIRAIKEAQAEKAQTKEARQELQDFMSALQSRKSAEKKTRDEYIDRKLEQLERRQKREQERRDRRNPLKDADSQTGSVQETDHFRTGPLKIGEKVRIKENGMVGEVTRVSIKNITITIGNISSKMSADRVERISSNEYRAAIKAAPMVRRVTEDPAIRERKLNFKTELDVRGESLSDALNIVMHYVDDAIMLGMSSVRIIHGKGSGVLHEEIQKYLKTVPGVSSVKDEHIQMGGSGVTIVSLD